MFESAMSSLCIVICGITIAMALLLIWRCQTPFARFAVAAIAGMFLLFRWQISLLIFQLVASIFTLIAMLIGFIVLCILPFVVIHWVMRR